MMKKLIGIDIGGTKISVILVSSRGRQLDWKVIPTRYGIKAKQSVRELVQVLENMLRANRVKHSDLRGIGVGVPGPVDPKRGVVPWSPNLPGWKGIKLKRILEGHFHVPVFMDNDANAAGFGEKIFGAGRNVKDFVYITVSTGIGGGLVMDGKIHRGASFCGGELGHMTIVPDGDLCKCGKRGCLEAHASGTAIARMAVSKIKHGAKSKLLTLARGVRQVSARTVSQAAELGDRVAIQTLREAGRYLGIGIANLINILNPEMVVLGGSVIKSGSYLWKPMIRSAKKESWPVAFKACKIRKTVLGDQVGNLGAAALVLEQRSRRV